MKAVEIETSIVFANNTILSCSFLFFLIIDLYFLILAVITQIFNPTAKVAIPTEIPSKTAKAKIETYTATIEIKINRCFKIIQSFTILFVLFIHQFILLYFFN